MSFDAVHLARLQFAFTMAFHIVFPAFSIGLASYLAVLEALWLRSGKQVYLDLFQYWLKVFAVAFGVGVVSGVVISYEFGTNWSSFARKAGAIVGPLMGYEVLTAFFLEAGFLGVMLFGMQRVGRGLHMLATALVALGTLISAFWILVVNSWMQTPTGFAMDGDKFVPADWWSIIFNPSMPYRIVHMVLASYLTVAFAVGSVGAWHLLRDNRNAACRTMFSMALWMAALVAPLQIVAGDLHGLNTLGHQPAKVAAMEGDWESRKGQPLILFGLPNMKTEHTDYAVEIPRLGALVLTHDWNGAIKGLKEFPPGQRPNAAILFWSFRIMIAIGFSMAALGCYSLWVRWRGTLFESRWLQRGMVAMAPSGFVALLCGWTTTEVGRQPYTVYGALKTVDSVAPIGAPGVAASLVAFALVYAVVFGSAAVFLFRLLTTPPTAGESGPPRDVPHRSAGVTPGPAQGAPVAEPA